MNTESLKVVLRAAAATGHPYAAAALLAWEGADAVIAKVQPSKEQIAASEALLKAAEADSNARLDKLDAEQGVDTKAKF